MIEITFPEHSYAIITIPETLARAISRSINLLCLLNPGHHTFTINHILGVEDHRNLSLFMYEECVPAYSFMSWFVRWIYTGTLSLPLEFALDMWHIADILRCSKAHVHNAIHGKVHGLPKLTHLTMGRRKLVRRDWLE